VQIDTRLYQIQQSSPLILINRFLDFPYDGASPFRDAFASLLRIWMDTRALVLLVAAEQVVREAVDVLAERVGRLL
jgi:hypothetical protein